MSSIEYALCHGEKKEICWALFRRFVLNKGPSTCTARGPRAEMISGLFGGGKPVCARRSVRPVPCAFLASWRGATIRRGESESERGGRCWARRGEVHTLTLPARHARVAAGVVGARLA